MKRLLVVLVIACMSVSLFAGCSAEEPTAAEPVIPEDKVEMTGNLQDIEDEHEGQKQSILTGEWISNEVSAIRPIAIMMGNTTAALPQHGINAAGVIYEAPVEGGLTRLMAVIQDYRSVDKIMSIRSCRHYFVHWALEYDALYAHYGQSKYAVDTLNSSYVNNLNGLDGAVGNAMYKRDDSRSAPHNVYTSGELILKGIEVKEYEMNLDSEYQGHFAFNSEEDSQIILTEGSEAEIVTPGYLVNKPYFKYNEADGLYYRFQYGDKQIDGIDNSQLSCKNIILQISEVSVIDEKYGYLDVETVGSGTGYYVTNGKVIPITWTKDSVQAPTKYYKEDGTELVLNIGKTWVCVVDDAYEDNIIFESGSNEQ